MYPTNPRELDRYGTGNKTNLTFHKNKNDGEHGITHDDGYAYEHTLYKNGAEIAEPQSLS